MTALAFDFTYDEPAPAPDQAPVARKLYAVRGTVGEASPAVADPAAAPVLRVVPTPTLDDLFSQTFLTLATGFAACPVCHEEAMTARWTAGHGLAGGRCASCGSALE